MGGHAARDRARAAPPESERELLDRAHALAGQPLAALAELLRRRPPSDLRRAKGWVGQLVEQLLGSSAASRDEPDFREIGVELKTLPVDRHGRPLESTFVCTIAMRELESIPWEQSRVRRKLARVLWLPVEGERSIPVAQRRVGTALLWRPSADDEAALRFDWEELAGIIGRGGIESLTGHMGRYLQVRPKAAHSRVRRTALDDEGGLITTLPRGFYLRTRFTASILARHYARPGSLR